ncbi:MAG: IPT/TIG domain-containing protein [Bacteroidota bacterium]
MNSVLRIFIVAGMTGTLLFGCKDLGSSSVPTQPPVVFSVSPSTAAVGDTIRIMGSNFGPVQASSEVLLANCSTAVIISWNDSEIRVKLPNIAANLAVRVNVGSRISNSVALGVTGFISGNVSYAAEVRSTLNYGCAISGCHIGSSAVSGFDQSTYAGLRAGGVNYGPNVVIPGDSTNSGIIREMRGIGIVGRMPFGGPWQASGVPDSLIRRTARWIQQGALYN